MSKFKFRDERDNQRYKELMEEETDSLKEQMVLMDLIAQWCVEDKSFGTAISAVNTRIKAKVADDNAKIRGHELLSKSAVSTFCQSISEIVISEINKTSLTTDEKNALVDSIHSKLAAKMQEGARNSETLLAAPLKAKK